MVSPNRCVHTTCDLQDRQSSVTEHQNKSSAFIYQFLRVVINVERYAVIHCTGKCAENGFTPMLGKGMPQRCVLVWYDNAGYILHLIIPQGFLDH